MKKLHFPPFVPEGCRYAGRCRCTGRLRRFFFQHCSRLQRSQLCCRFRYRQLRCKHQAVDYPIGGWGKDETVQELISSFNAKYPDIKVTVEYLDYTNGDDQVNTAIEGGSAPDLIMEGPERLVANWGAKGLMADLSRPVDRRPEGRHQRQR